MRQVPKYLVIGSGRMTRHFCHYLTLLKLPFHNWSRKDNSPAELIKFNEDCSHVLVLISDAAIDPFLTEHAFLKDKCCVHFSGCLVSKNAYSAHPFMPFGHELYDLETYNTVPFILEENGPDLAELLPGIPNKSYKIAANLKPLYHALGMIGCNFTTMLWQKVFKDFKEKLNLPLEVTHPLLKQMIANIIANPDGALTGPLTRNDQETINMHLKALQNDPYKKIYQAFVDVFQQNRVKK